jgi:hypothetical protein
MDSWQMALFFGLAVVGVYKLVEGFNRVSGELKEVNKRLDLIYTQAERVDPEAYFRILVDQLELLKQIAEQQQPK